MQYETTPQQQPSNAHALPKSKPLSVFDFLDYREYLTQWLSSRKQFQSNYSGVMFAKKAGFQSHTLLGMVIRGKRNLSSDTIRSFSKALGLNGKESLYFEKLVLFNQAKNSEDKTYYFSQLTDLASDQKSSAVTLISGYANCMSNWYTFVIREMVSLSDFDPSPEWIVKRLRNLITPKQAQEALSTLIELGFLVKIENEKGEVKLIQRESDFRVLPNKIDFAVRNYHRQNMQLGIHMIDQATLDERQLLSLTLPVTDAEIKLINERLLEVLKEIQDKFSGSKTNQDQVMNVNFQSLVVTSKERLKK